MSYNLLSLTALIALVPATLAPFRRSAERDSVFWIVWAVAVVGAALWVFVRQSVGWGTVSRQRFGSPYSLVCSSMVAFVC